MAFALAERRRAEPQRDRIRLSVLAEVGLLFTCGGDEVDILRRVAEIAVPTLADACSVLRSGATGLEPVAGQRAENLSGTVCTQISVPLLVRGDVIGILVLQRMTPNCTYTNDDLVFAEELARRIAMHVDHARLLSDQAQLISELEQSNRELDRFADVASRDLKAPLRGIGHLATWIEEDLSPFVNEGGRTHLQLLRGRVQRLEDMIDGILRYSRAGRIIDDPVEVDVRELTTEVVGLLAAPPEASIVIDPSLPTLRTVRVPLQQVFLNLINNALAHASHKPCVHVGGTQIDGGWEFYVRDDGKGIPSAHHEDIWQMFKTVRQREPATTGIGLSIVRRIVESVGGHAWVESELGSGATFRFTWPATLQRTWKRCASASTGALK